MVDRTLVRSEATTMSNGSEREREGEGYLFSKLERTQNSTFVCLRLIIASTEKTKKIHT